MFSTWPGVRLKARPLLSAGTMLVRPFTVTPWSAWLGAVPCRGDGVGRRGQALLVQGGADVARVVGLDGQDAGRRAQVGLVADQRGGALVGGHADVLEQER